MVKVIVHITKAIILIALSILTVSCRFDVMGKSGDGNVVMKQRNVTAEVNHVSVSGNIEAIISQGDQASVKVEADSNLQEHIKVEAKGDKLEVFTDVNIGDAAAKRVIITLPNIKKIEAEAASQVSTKDAVRGDKIAVSAGSGAHLMASLSTPHAKCEASSGGSLELAGGIQNLDADASSGASIDATKVKAVNAKCDVSSGGSIAINEVTALKADASSGGHITYKGNPAKLEKNASSGGSVKQD